MMRNSFNHMGHHSGFGPGPMHNHGPMRGPGPMYGPGPMRGMGPGFMGLHHRPHPVHRVWGGPWIRSWHRYNDGCGCFGCLGPFLMLILLASAFGFMI